MSMHKRAGVLVKGLQIWWEDKYPADERTKPEKSGIGHRNFALRPTAASIFETIKHGAAAEKPMMWEITVTPVLSMASGDLLEESRIIRAHATIADISAVCIDEIRDATAEGESLGGTYLTTRFHLECLGMQPIKTIEETIECQM